MDERPSAVFALELFEGGFGVGVGRERDRVRARAWNTGRETFDLADGHTAASDFLGEIEPRFGVGDGEQGAGVAGGDAALFDKLTNGSFELEQTEGVGDGGAIFSGALGDLLLSEVELVGKALEGVGLLDGIEILALEVFDEGHFHRHTLRYVTDDNGHAVHFGALSGAPTPFASD